MEFPTSGTLRLFRWSWTGPAKAGLDVSVDLLGKRATVTFVLESWIDLAIRGFSNQNVVGGLKLRSAEGRQQEPWEYGVGCKPGKFEIELEPCFGAYGTIRADIASISIAPVS
jgi:hypothetical protein